MKNSVVKFSILSRSLSFLIIFLTVISCENKIKFIPKSDLLTLPSLTVRDFETFYTDSGKLQLEMSAPLMEQYLNNESPYYEFSSGIKDRFL